MAAGGLATAASLLGIFAVFDPIGFRNTIFVPIREVSLFAAQLKPFAASEKLQSIELSEPVRLRIPKDNPENIETVADLYRPAPVAGALGILLLHGSSVYGRRSGFIRLLGSEFQARGWIALAPDARGFGETDDPASIRLPESWGVKRDINRSLQFLIDSGADANRLFVFGHSLGVDHSLEGALNHRRVQKIVLASPGVYVDGATGQWQLVRFAADRQLPEVLPLNVVESIRRPGSFNGLAEGALRSQREQPLMLVYGKGDNEAVVGHYLRISQDIAEPFELRGVANAGHWFGVRSFFGSDAVYYRQDIFDEFLAVIFEFLESTR